MCNIINTKKERKNCIFRFATVDNQYNNTADGLIKCLYHRYVRRFFFKKNTYNFFL